MNQEEKRSILQEIWNLFRDRWSQSKLSITTPQAIQSIDRVWDFPMFELMKDGNRHRYELALIDARKRREVVVKIDDKNLEKFGDMALVGKLATDLVTGDALEITLLFSQSTMAELSHRGPNTWICLEHNIPCLIDSIIRLIAMGHTVKVEIVRQ